MRWRTKKDGDRQAMVVATLRGISLGGTKRDQRLDTSRRHRKDRIWKILEQPRITIGPTAESNSALDQVGNTVIQRPSIEANEK